MQKAMHKVLYMRDDIDRLFVSRKEERKGLISIEDSIDESIRGLENYVKREQKKTNFSDQKQHRQHNDQRTGIFQAIKWLYLIGEDLKVSK